MELEWPLMGRSTELQRVGTRLRSGRGAIVVAGAAGVGKTRLATECLLAAASAGFVPLRVAATSATASLPLGAFAELLPDIDGGISRPDLLRRVARSIVEKGGGAPVAIMVDDAHLLDEASAALTHQLARADGAFLLVTIRSGEPASDAVMALWKDGLAERIDLRPLNVEHVRGLLTAVLKGPVDGATAHRFCDRTEGNSLFLRELVLASLDAGVLREEEGVWRLAGSLPTSDRLVEIVESRLGKIDEATRAWLELLALGEPLEVEIAQGLAGDLDLPDLLFVLLHHGFRPVSHPLGIRDRLPDSHIEIEIEIQIHLLQSGRLDLAGDLFS
ncbi:MAG: AAA family ATPase, partial [Actinobacteria bacterium]|nr:AAA family ATPase [Actinomycetota bacterium]